MPTPTYRPIAEPLLQLAMQRLRAGVPTRVLWRELHLDGTKLKRALIGRFGEEYTQIMQHRAQHRRPPQKRRQAQLDERKSPYRDKNRGHQMAHLPDEPKPQPKRRACLRCDRQFLSEGAHNALCSACRTIMDAGPSAAQEYRLRTPGRRR